MGRRREMVICLELFLCVFFVGCVKMRDYTGVREGAFGLDIKTGFDEGADKKDYYLVGDNVGIIIGDTKNEIITKIGLPHSIETTLEGYERWGYEDRGIILFLKDDKINSWRLLKYK